jgi:hypothetical protein
MRALRRRWAAAAIVMAGCVCPGWAAEPLELNVGAHRVTLTAPERWAHIDDGDAHRFRWRGAQIEVADVGPVTLAGIRSEIQRARGLYLIGAAAESSDVVNGLRLRGLFASQQRWDDFLVAWDTVRRARANDDRAAKRAVDGAFQTVLGEIARLPQPSLPELAAGAVAELEPMDRREIAMQREISIAGRSGLAIDTWDRLAHAQRKRYVFVVNEGDVLMVRMVFGAFESIEDTFDDLVASIRY